MEEQSFGSPLDEAFDSPTSTLEEEFEPSEEKQVDLTTETVSLLTLGHLTGSVKIGSHDIQLRTLKIGEELEAALLAKKYEETVEAGRALAVALVAAAITSVDGQPLVRNALGPDEHTLEGRFHYLQRNWYWPPIYAVYQEYGSLNKQAREAFENLKKV
jgi:hypothetical protein